MKSPVRYIFDRSFDAPEVKEEVIEDLPPTFSEEELHLAERSAFQEGVLEGRRSAEAEIASHLLQAMNHWGERLDAFMDLDHHKQKSLQQDAAHLAHRIALKACRETLYPHAAQIVEESFQTATSFMLMPDKVSIHIHPDLLDVVQSHLQAMVAKGTLEITADPSMEVGDCQLSWHGGGAEFKLNETLKKIDSYIKDYTEDKDHG